MGRSFDEAHKAYENGDGARAKELSNAGKTAQKEMERLNDEAAAWIFRGACRMGYVVPVPGVDVGLC